jgi:ATP-grasp domain
VTRRSTLPRTGQDPGRPGRAGRVARAGAVEGSEAAQVAAAPALAPGLAAAFDALLEGRREGVLASEGAVEAAGWPAELARVVPERELPAALREGGGARVLLMHRVPLTLVRALHSHPVPLVVLTADAEASRAAAVAAAPGVTVLGPGARLRRGAGVAIVCAADPAELEGLWRALGGARLGVSPTPRWWWRLLERKAAQQCPAAGYVPAAVLDEGWARWAAGRGPDHVLVPLGVPLPAVDEPADPDAGPGLAAAVAAHALERWTGPVFPSPRVIGSVLKGLRGGGEGHGEGSPPDPGIWQQARRALPLTGAIVGMEAPRPELALDVATAAFLAQRALLRVDAARAALAVELPTPTFEDAEGVVRAGEVLASAGQVLTDHESKVVLRGFGIEVTRQAVASSASGAAGYADRIGYPVALKALSPDLRRRAEIGAMQLDLGTGASVRRAYGMIVDAMEKHAPTARLDGVLVAEMVAPGLDLCCGAIRLPDGGAALYGRVMEGAAPVEPVLAPCPVGRDDALLLAHAILGRMPVPALRRASDPDARELATLLLRLDALVRELGERLELVELRPVRLLAGQAAGERGYVTLDARIVQVAHLQGR